RWGTPCAWEGASLNEVAVEADGLTKTYSQDGESFNAVDAVSFELPFRGVFGLLGPNGAGKTTTLEMLAGLRPADRGSVRVLGVDPFVDRQTMTRRLSIQPQKAALFQHRPCKSSSECGRRSFRIRARPRTSLRNLTSARPHALGSLTSLAVNCSGFSWALRSFRAQKSLFSTSRLPDSIRISEMTFGA